ncbi:hypothetical protein NC651_019927 [Populus alba x Populus x berolinensis]|nr:hypothetical protein NC651_019927 [Populus alba x Populus x berolinensis]
MCVREVAVLGKRVYEGLACDVVVPLCGGTCDKMLSCGLHRFHERCHRRHCIETCRIVVIKLCQCGEMKIEICGKRLQCENHKCPDPCQRGACAPCTIMFTISCACGDAHFEVSVLLILDIFLISCSHYFNDF